MVVLDEMGVKACQPGKLAGIEAFEEKAAAVTEELGLDDQYVGYVCCDYVHGNFLTSVLRGGPYRPRSM
ncbi:hypothetical protein D3C73_1224500 [compost metagenome]